MVSPSRPQRLMQVARSRRSSVLQHLVDFVKIAIGFEDDDIIRPIHNFLELGRAQGPGDQVEGFLAFGEGDVGQGGGGAVGGDARDGDDAHLGVEALEGLQEIPEGGVGQGVPQGDEGGVAAGGQHLQDPAGILLPGGGQHLGVPAHGKGQVLDAGAVQVAAHDAQGQAVAVLGGAGGKDVGHLVEHLDGLQGDQFGVSRPYANPVKGPGWSWS